MFFLEKSADPNGYRSTSGIDNNYAAFAAVAGVSLITAAISVNMFANNDVNMIESLISPFGFGRTSKSTAIASNIPNLGIVLNNFPKIDAIIFKLTLSCLLSLCVSKSKFLF